jgi:hypothetical protein
VTMIDEEVLRQTLSDIAGAFHPSDEAIERILAQLEGEPAISGPLDAVKGTARIPRRRALLVAAVVVLLACGLAVSVGNLPNSNSNSASAPRNSAALPIEPQRSSVSASGSKGLPSYARPPASKSDSPIPPGSVGQSAKVEANGSVDLTIADGTLQAVLGRLTGLASAEGGFVASTQAQLGRGSPSTGVIVLRVPEANFGALVTQVQHYGHPTSVTTTSQDVTGQYVNLQAQISALQSSRQQYLTIMTRASSIGDILAVQSQLDTIQSQIDQLQGQLNVLDNETTYGTLSVSLSEPGKSPRPPPRPRPPSSGLLKAWDRSVGGFVSGFEWIIRIAGPLLLVLICLAGLFLFGRYTWRATRRRML